MKARLGYVSNSSSSSFMVENPGVDDISREANEREAEAYIVSHALDEIELHGKWNGLLEEGETKFGWQEEEYHDIASKWNWLVLQAFYGGQNEMTLIDNYLNRLDSRIHVNWNDVEERDDKAYAYIDHQSVSPIDTFHFIEMVGGIGEWCGDWYCFISNGNDNH